MGDNNFISLVFNLLGKLYLAPVKIFNNVLYGYRYLLIAISTESNSRTCIPLCLLPSIKIYRVYLLFLPMPKNFNTPTCQDVS